MLPVGLCCPGCGAAGLPEAAVATVEPERRLSGPAIDRTARDSRRMDGTARSAAAAVLAPHEESDGRHTRQRHESILKKGGARRATAAARRRTTGAFFVEAPASSAEAASARRPRSGTPRRHHLREAPSGPRPSSGSSARTSSPQVGSSGPFCSGSAAASARRGPGTTAGRAAFVQLVAAVVEGFVEAVPAAGSRRRTRPET